MPPKNQPPPPPKDKDPRGPGAPPWSPPRR